MLLKERFPTQKRVPYESTNLLLPGYRHMVGEENKDITMNSFKKRYNHECKVQTEYASQAQKQLHYLIPKVNITVDACSHNIEPRDAHSFEPSRQWKAHMKGAHLQQPELSTRNMVLHYSSPIMCASYRHLTTPLTVTDQMNEWCPPGSTKAQGGWALTRSPWVPILQSGTGWLA
jgi:hypothetical protein